MALRTSGHLLLGVVRIYSRKAKYLLADCNEAFVKIKMAFRPGMVDLPEENREAAVNAITLPEVFHDFDTEMPNLDAEDIQRQFSMNQTRAEEITLREDDGNINFDTGENDGFGDMPSMTGDDSEEIVRSGSLHTGSVQAEQSSLFNEEPLPSTSKDNDDFGGAGFEGSGGPGLFDEEGGGGEGGLFDEPMPQNDARKLTPRPVDDDHDDMSDHGADFPPSPGGASSIGGDSRPATPAQQSIEMAPPPTMDESSNKTAPVEHTTLLHNEEESFALAPVDASQIRGGMVRTKRKRKLIVDEIKAIAGEEMKAQLSDTADIVTTLDLAPPTKRLMHWKETGGVEKLFALPGRTLNSQALFKAYQNNLTAKIVENEYFGLLGDSEKETIQLERVPGEFDEEFGSVAKRGPGRPPKRKTMEGESPAKRVSPRKEQRLEDQQQVHQQMRSEQQQRADELAAMAANQTGFDQFQQQSQVFDQQNPQTPANAEAQFDNMGYDPNNPNVSNNWDESVNPMSHGAPTPGAPSMGAPTPYREDEEEEDGYYNPASVSNQKEEEMKEDETIEQFEDRVLNKRAAHLNTILRTKFEESQGHPLTFGELPIRRSRKAMAQSFYSLLVLQKVMAVDLSQEEEFVGRLEIKKGPNFETAVL